MTRRLLEGAAGAEVVALGWADRARLEALAGGLPGVGGAARGVPRLVLVHGGRVGAGAGMSPTGARPRAPAADGTCGCNTTHFRPWT